MSLELWLGNAGSGKSHNLYKRIIEEAAKHPDLNYLIIVPEQFTLQTQYNLVNMSPAKGILNVDVLSFARLAHRVFEEVGYAHASGILLDDMGKNLILRRLASQYENYLPLLGRHLKKLGYISEIKSVISEFMQYGVGDNEISLLIKNAEQSGKGMLSSKLNDIQTLYKAFRSYIDEKYITTEELLDRVSHVLPDSAKMKKSIIAFDGFTGFTPVQYNLIEKLMENCLEVKFTILADTKEGRLDLMYEPDEQNLFYMSQKTIMELKKRAEEVHVNKVPDVIIKEEIPVRYRKNAGSENSNIMIIHLEKNIFRENPVSMEASEGNDITILNAINPNDEIKSVAIEIGRLVREKGYRYKDIAVVSGDLETYMHEAERVFPRYEIPFFVDKTQPVLLNPFIEYIRAIMAIITDDYSYESMFRYLKSSLSDIQPEQVDRLENYVLACGIRGYKEWNGRFIRKLKDMTEDELQSIDETRSLVMEELKPLADFPNNDQPLRNVAAVLYQVIISRNIQSKLEHMAQEFLKDGLSVKAKEYEQIYGRIMELLDKLVEILGDEEISIKEFAELMDAGFDEIRVGLIPKESDYVQIGDITRSRLRDIKILFFVGVNDGIVPMSSNSGGILSDMDREYFISSDCDIELAPSGRQQAYQQRLYLYMLMSKPEEHLYISYSRLSQDGKSLRPSYLINPLKTLYSGIKITRSEEKSLKDRLINERSAFYELTSGIQDYISDATGQEDRDTMSELIRYFAEDNDYNLRMKRICNQAFSLEVFKASDAISKAVANVLYGKNLTASVTRLESYARCAYKHFLQYGLGLKERMIFDFEAKDMGSIFHESLQKYAEVMKENGANWFTISDMDASKYVTEAVERCVANGDYAVIYSSFRNTYMIERMKRIVKRSVSVLTHQIRKGEFAPTKFELSFSSQNECKALNFELSEDEKMRLIGRIDRLDINKNDRNVFVKIIDYKSGNQDFDLAAVYEGTQLQLVVYLNAAMEMVEDKEHEAVPAGILYYHIDDPLVEGTSKDSVDVINSKINKQLSMKGLVNSDEAIIKMMDKDFDETNNSDIIPVSKLKNGNFSAYSSVATTDEFAIISEYVNAKIKEMGRGIVDGNTECTSGKCDFCSFSGICRHSEMNVKDKKPLKLKNAEAIMAMKSSLEG